MKTYSQLQKIIAVLITFILMIELTGCYSTKTISTSEIKKSDIYLIHCKNSNYPVNNVIISNEILSGSLDAGIDNHGKIIKNHIYLSSDSAINFNNYLITVPIDKIAKIEQKVYDPGKTKTLKASLIIGGGVLVVITIIGTVYLIKELGEIAYPSDGSTGLCSNW
jgi:hypothetical protein